MFLRKMRVVAACLVLLACLVPHEVSAQATTGTIEGQIKDVQGAVLPGVAVTARNTNTAATFNTVTTGEGFYRLTYLPLGTYDVRAELSGFRTEVKQGLGVSLNQSTVVSFTLSIASIKEEVSVVGQTPVVQSTKSEVRRALDEKALVEAPIASSGTGRNVYAFATLAPGVTTPVRFDRAFLGSGGSNVIANGTTSRSSNFELDGISNVDPEDNDYRVAVSVEGIKEFEVITSNYNAEFGRAGGAQSRAVTKSGSNQFHGSGWEFFYDNAAFNWPGNADLQQKRCSDAERKASPSRCYAPYRMNTFGGSLGGPIKKDKVFFFAMFEDNIRRGQNFYSGLVPLATERTPNTGSTAGDAIVADWLKLYPQPNRTDINIRRYETNEPYNWDTPNPFGRIDLNLSNSTKVMGRYDLRNQQYAITRVFKSNGGNILDRAHTGGATLTHIFSPTLVGEFRGGYAYRRVDLPTEKGFEDFPTITVSGLGTLGAQSNQYPIYRYLHDVQTAGSVSWVRGRHAVKGGYDVHRTYNDGIQSDYVRGLINFGTGYGRTGIQNLLAGTPTSYQLTIGDVNRNFRNWDFAFYVQDDIRLKRLTLNLGLRNESVTEWKEKDGKTNFGYGSSLANPAPRVGAAWDATGSGKWVVRGAYGLSYDRVNFFILRSLQFQAPLVRTIVLNPTSASQPLRVENLGPNAGTIAASTPSKFDVDPNFGLGKVHTWNVTLEHDLGHSMSARVSYIGTATREMPSTLVLNRAVPGAGATFYNRQQRRTDPTVTNWLRLANASLGNYRGLQVSVERRYRQGLQFQASYTYSLAKDLASDTGFASGDVYYSMLWNADVAFNDNGDIGLRRSDMYGPSRYDQRHVFSFNASYELPWKRRPGIVGALVSDWQVSTTTYYRDGYPVNVFCGLNSGDCNIDGLGSDRPNVIDASVVGRQFKQTPVTAADTQIQRILPSAFDQTMAAGAGVNLGRNTFRTDPFLSVSAAFIRNIFLFGQHRLQVRVEMYDLFNNTYAGAPSLSLATPADFGKISTVGGNRSMQLGFRYTW